MITIFRSLMYLKEAAVRIQGKNMDLVASVSIVMECCKKLKTLRQDIDGYAKRIYEHGVRIADVSGITVSMPRISKDYNNLKAYLSYLTTYSADKHQMFYVVVFIG